MDINKQRKIIAILKALKNANRSMGSTNIAEELQGLGINFIIAGFMSLGFMAFAGLG